MTASVTFFSLGYGARLLRLLFAQPGTWRAMEFGIALIMSMIGAARCAC
jgi:L-lysine exporter family protein LysE/ArgO